MNTNVIDFKGQKVSSKFAHIDINKGLGDGVQGGFPVVNYRGKNWNLRYQGVTHFFTREDDGSQMTYLDVIIVGDPGYVSKNYFGKGAWSEDSSGPPLCSAIRGERPDPGVPEPQSKACAGCPNDAWITMPNGRRGKYCQDHKRLAVLLMPAVTKRMLGAPLLEPAFLKIPPASLAGLKSYGAMLQHEGVPFVSLITRISFSPEKEKMFHMVFSPLQLLNDREADMVLPLLEDQRTKRIIGETPSIREVYQESLPPPRESSRIETGLEEAFEPETASASAPQPQAEMEITPPPVKRGRGRPPKARVVEEVEDQDDEASPDNMAAPAPAPIVASTTPVADEEGYTDYDDEVKNLLSQKTDGMLK